MSSRRIAPLRRVGAPADPLPSPDTILRHLAETDTAAYEAMLALMRFGYDQWRRARLERSLAVPDAP